MNIDKSLISGSTAMMVLKLLSEKDMYGYEMIEVLRERSQNVFELKAGDAVSAASRTGREGDAVERCVKRREIRYANTTVLQSAGERCWKKRKASGRFIPKLSPVCLE